RLALLPRGAAELLQAASVLGADFSPAELADLRGRPAADVAAALGPGVDDGLLGGLGDRLVFRHQLVRDAIYEQMPVALRSALHRDIGRMLAAHGADAARVATQLGLGGPEARAEAVAWLRRAAADAGGASPAEAADLLDRALDLAGPAHPDR